MRSGQTTMPRRALAALSLTSMALLLYGCAALHDGFETTAHVVSSPVAVADAKEAKPIRLDLKTVRSNGNADAPNAEAAAVPSPKEIFDFHPAGSRPDQWRQPFDIDANDGPLTADVRKTAAELKAFNAEVRPGEAVAARKRCGEVDVAQRKPGCGGVKPQTASTITRDPLAFQ